MNLTLQQHRDKAKSGGWLLDESIQGITLAAILRIADSCDSMARNHIRMADDLEYYQGQYKLQVAKREAVEHKVAALRGVITKMRGKAKPPEVQG